MTIWWLRVADSLVAMVRRLHPSIKRKIRASLATISRDPQAGRLLRDELEGLRNFRVGRFRIIYRILDEERTVEVVAIGHREYIYEETLRFVTRDSRN